MRRLPLLLLCLLASCDTVGGNGESDEESIFLAEPGPILFVSNKAGATQLFSMEGDGSDIRQLTDDASQPVFDAVWSPDGRQIALIMQVGEPSPFHGASLFVVNADGTGLRELVLAGGEAGLIDISEPVWSPDGEQIAFRGQIPPEALGAFGLFVVGLDGGDVRPLVPVASASDPSTKPDYLRGWAEDGRLLGDLFDASVRNAAGQYVENGRVVVFDLEGNILETLLETTGAPDYTEPYWYPQAPLWSGDEQRIMFTRRLLYRTTYGGYPLATVQEDLHVLESGQAEPVQITDGGHKYIYPVAWSPDDALVLGVAIYAIPDPEPYAPSTTPEHIVLVNADGSGLRDITPFPGVSSIPTSWRR